MSSEKLANLKRAALERGGKQLGRDGEYQGGRPWLPEAFSSDRFPFMVQQVSADLRWDLADAYAFCVALLESVNAHPEAKAVNAYFNGCLVGTGADLEGGGT